MLKGYDSWKLKAADDDLDPEQSPGWCHDCGAEVEAGQDQCDACGRREDHADALNDEAACREDF